MEKSIYTKKEKKNLSLACLAICLFFKETEPSMLINRVLTKNKCIQLGFILKCLYEIIICWLSRFKVFYEGGFLNSSCRCCWDRQGNERILICRWREQFSRPVMQPHVIFALKHVIKFVMKPRGPKYDLHICIPRPWA